MRNGLVKKVKIVLQKVELGCQNILLNHWFAATKKCQMCIFILFSTQHGATLHQDHVLQDALKRQKEECKEWTSHSNRYNKKIEQKIIALITLGVPQQLFCVCPGTLKASSRPSDDIHRPSHKLPALVRDHALSLARNRNKSSEVFYLLKWNEKFPSFNKVFWGGQPSIWGNFIKGSSRRDERSRREKRILTQHFVRVVHTATVIRWISPS